MLEPKNRQSSKYLPAIMMRNIAKAKQGGRYLRLFLFFFVLFALWSKPQLTSWNDESRIAQIQSLVEHGTLIIDKSSFSETGDKYFYNNHFYSEKPPLLAFYVAPFYFGLRLWGFSFEKNFLLCYYLLTLLSMGVLSALGLMVFRKIVIEFYKADNEWADVLTFITGAGTLIFPYSLMLNNHVPSGVLILSGFYCLLRYAAFFDKAFGGYPKIRENGAIKNAFFSGIFFSLSGAIDITCFLFVPFMGVPFFKKSIKAGIIYGMSCLPAITLYFILNFHTSGSLLPPAMNPSLWIYPGSFFGKESLSGLARHKNIIDVLCYSFHMLLGNRGLISHTPILIFSAFGLFLIFNKNSRFQYKSEYGALLSACFLFIVIYMLRSTNYSGFAFGIRWFASLMLCLCPPLACLEEKIRSSPVIRGLFIGTACISIFISLIGAYYPISPLVVADMQERSPTNTILLNLKFIIHDFSDAFFAKYSMKEMLKIIRFAISGFLLFFLFYRFMKNCSSNKEYPNL